MIPRNNLLSPAQAAVYNTIMRGQSCIWLTERQSGKTYVGVRCIEAISGVLFSGNVFQCGKNKQEYPDIYCQPPHQIRTYSYDKRALPLDLAVFDNFEMYDYQYLQDMLKVNTHQGLYMASYWSRTALSSGKYEMIVQALVAKGAVVVNG